MSTVSSSELSTVHFGDQVALFGVSENGYISAGGLDGRVWIDQLIPNVSLPPNLRECRFSVVSRFQYGQRKVLFRYLSTLGKTLEEYLLDSASSGDKEFRIRYENYLEEQELNEAENVRVQGKPVTYGSAVQLRHNITGKYVTAQKTVADFNQKALKISLVDDGSEGSCFDIVPGYKTVALGSFVRSNDVVCLQPVKFPHQYIGTTYLEPEICKAHRGESPQIKTSYEVDIHSQGTLLRVVHIHKFPAFYENFDSCLVGGSNITIVHKDTDSYLSFDRAVNQVHFRSTHKIAEERLYTNAHWKAEGASVHFSGDPIHYSVTPFRLKHLSSGLYLCARAESSSRKEKGTGGPEEDPVADESWDDSSSKRRVILAVTDDYLSPDTIWYCDPFGVDAAEQQSGQEKPVPKKTSVYIRHATHGWIEEIGVPIPPPVTPQSLLRENKGVHRSKFIHGGVSPKFKVRDVLGIEPVDPEVFKMMLKTQMYMVQLQTFVNMLETVPNAKKGSIEPAKQVRKLSIEYGGIVLEVLSAMIFSLCTSQNTNPFTREGIPNRSCQKIFRQQGIVDVVVKIVTLPFKKGLDIKGERFPGLGSPELATLSRVLQLSHRVLRFFCLNYLRNKVEMVPFLEIFEGQLVGAFNASFTLMEIFKDSFELIQRFVNEKTISRLVKMIGDEGRKPYFILFLSAVIQSGGIELPFNQNIVADMFLKAKCKQGHRLLYRTKLSSSAGEKTYSPGSPSLISKWGRVHSSLNLHDKLVLSVYDPVEDEWISMNSFKKDADSIFAKDVNDIEDPKELLLRYHCRCVDLLAELLLGRNRKTFTMILFLEDFNVRYDDLMKIVFCDDLPSRVRASYATLLWRLYLDRDPYTAEPTKTPVLFAMNKISSTEEQEKAGGLGDVMRGVSQDLAGKLNPFSSPELVNVAPTPGFEDFKADAFAYLSAMKQINAHKVGENQLTTIIVEMISFLFIHGFYTGMPGRGKMNLDEIKRLVPAIVNALNPGIDQPIGFCLAHTPESEIVMNFKKKLCELLQIIFDVRTNIRTKKIFDVFDSQFDQIAAKEKSNASSNVGPKKVRMLSSSSACSGGEQSLSTSVSARRAKSVLAQNKYMLSGEVFFGGDGKVAGSVTKKSMQALIDDMFKKPIIHPLVAISGPEADRFVNVLLGLTSYSSNSLKEIAFTLLFGHFQQRSETITSALSVHVVRTNRLSSLYRTALGLAYDLQRLRKWIPEESRRMMLASEKVDPYRRCLEVLSGLSEITKDADTPEELRQNQMTMISARVHTAALQILRLPLRVSRDGVVDIPERRELFQACYNIIRDIAKNNEKAQEMLFEHLEFFAQHMGVQGLNVADTITAICENNENILANVPEKVMRRFVYLLTEVARFPRWLRFLEGMLVVRGVPMKGAQARVLRLCIDNDFLEVHADNGERRRSILGRKKPSFNREKLMLMDEHKKKMGSQLQYHALSIIVLAKCCYGKARSNEVKCRAVLSFAEVMHNLMDVLTLSHNRKISADTIRYIRHPYVIFLNACYTDTNHPTAKSHSQSENNRYFYTEKPGDASLWGQIADDIEALVLRLKRLDDDIPDKIKKSEKRKLEVEADPDNRAIHLNLVMNGYVPFLDSYYSKHYNPAAVHPTIGECMAGHTKRVHQAMKDLLETSSLGEFVEPEELAVLKSTTENIRCAVEGIPYVDTAESNKNTGARYLEWDPDLLYQKEMKKFLVDVGSAIGIADFSRMIGIGMRDVAGLLVKSDKDSSVEALGKFLYINGHNIDATKTANSLRVLRAVLYFNPAKLPSVQVQEWDDFVNNRPITYPSSRKNASDLLRSAQVRYSKLGIPEMALELLSHSDDSVTLAALRLLKAMGQGGNRDVQDTWFRHLSTNPHSTFWSSVSLILSNSVNVVKRMRKLTSKSLSLQSDTGSISLEAVHDCLRVLDYMLVGSHKGLQGLFRGQPGALHSVDMMAELVKFALEIQPELTLAFDYQQNSILDIMSQVFQVLARCLHGPNEKNQNWMLKTKIAEVCNRINDISNAVDDHTVSIWWTRVRKSILNFLLAMLEGTHTNVGEHLLYTMDWGKLKECYDRSVGIITGKNFDPWTNYELIKESTFGQDGIYSPNKRKKSSAFVDKVWRDELIEEANLYFFLSEYIQRHEIGSAEANSPEVCLVAHSGSCPRKARTSEGLCIMHSFRSNDDAVILARKYAGRIEIERNNRPEPLLFHTHLDRSIRYLRSVKKPFLLRLHKEYDEDALLRMKSFLPLLQDTLFDLRREESMRINWMTKWIQYVDWAEFRVPLLLTIVINIWFIIFGAQYNHSLLWDKKFESDVVNKPEWSYPIFRVLMGVHLVVSVLILLLYFVKHVPNTIFRMMNERKRLVAKRIHKPEIERTFVSPVVVPVAEYKILYRLLFIPSSDLIWVYYMVLYPFFSLLGNFVSPLFFIYHLLDVLQDKTLNLVLRSVTRNFDKLIKTAILSLIMLYFFSAINYAAYSTETDGCSTLFQCFATYVYSGSIQLVVTEGVENFTVPETVWASNAHDELGRMAIHAAFGILFIIIILNVLSGIIIDSFGELRDEAQRVRDSLRMQCYVCGLGKYTHDEYGNGFNTHVDAEHNYFNFVRFMAYIENRDDFSLTGQEQWVKGKLAKGSIDWFPVGSAYTVVERKDHQKEIVKSIQEEVKQLRTVVSIIADHLGLKNGGGGPTM